MRMPGLNRRPQCGAGRENVFLPYELIQIPRPHPHRQRRIRSWNVGLGGSACIEELIGHRR
jgi:hypothetical protein